MLLVLAQPNDETSERFIAYARFAGVECVAAQDGEHIDLLVTAEHDCSVVVELRGGQERKLIRGVINRGVPLSPGNSEDELFQASEPLASWWSALCCFSGSVINRPSRFGFFPTLDILSLAKSVPQIRPSRGLISTSPPPHSLGEIENVHRLRDGLFLGRLGARSTDLDMAEVYVFTPFDPDHIIHILLAGNKVFDLSHPLGKVTPAFAEQLSPLIHELHQRHATFSLIILEQTAPGLRILHTTAFPAVYQYKHIETAVHSALLEYLTS